MQATKLISLSVRTGNLIAKDTESWHRVSSSSESQISYVYDTDIWVERVKKGPGR